MRLLSAAAEIYIGNAERFKDMVSPPLYISACEGSSQGKQPSGWLEKGKCFDRVLLS